MYGDRPGTEIGWRGSVPDVEAVTDWHQCVFANTSPCPNPDVVVSRGHVWRHIVVNKAVLISIWYYKCSQCNSFFHSHFPGMHYVRLSGNRAPARCHPDERELALTCRPRPEVTN